MGEESIRRPPESKKARITCVQAEWRPEQRGSTGGGQDAEQPAAIEW